MSNQKVIRLNVINFINSVHALTSTYGIDEDKNPFCNQYTSVLSYLIARNGIIQTNVLIPIEHLNHCKDIFEVARINFFTIETNENPDQVA